MRSKNNLQGVRSIVKQICSRIARLIRDHKIIAITFVVTLLIMIAFIIKSTYSVPICRNQPSIKIVNESVRESWQKRIPNEHETTAENVHFKQYVTTISKIFLHKINNMGQCKEALNGQPQVELVFVYRPLISDGIEPFDFERNKTDPIRQLDSPWVKLTINKSPNPLIRAAFIWSERQYLLDQALISGMSVSSTNSPMPLQESTFMKYGRDYMHNYFFAKSPAAEAIAKVDLVKRLPADILWLFDNGLMTGLTMDDDQAISATEFRLEHERFGYNDLTEALIDRFFASSKTEIHYNSVLDLKDIFNLDKYRINSLIIHSPR
jgi:hypothetical protein